MAEVKYTEADLVTFGKYLLSKERKELTSKQVRDEVTHADLENWKHKQKNGDNSK